MAQSGGRERNVEREVKLERVREMVRVSNEIGQLKKIEEHFERERRLVEEESNIPPRAKALEEIDDVIVSARQSIRRYEAEIFGLLRA